MVDVYQWNSCRLTPVRRPVVIEENAPTTRAIISVVLYGNPCNVFITYEDGKVIHTVVAIHCSIRWSSAENHGLV